MSDDHEGGPERRQLLTQDVMERTGIDEAMIRRLVHAFYGAVRADPLIGPVFLGQVKDWDRHLAQMCDFWSSVALMTGRYHGRPMAPHIRLGLERAHFDRWLALFEETARRECAGDAAAAHFVERAHRIAESFELGIATHHGRPFPQRRPRPAWLVDVDQRAGTATA
ncbi:hemoglobin [Stella humosa]|uniref:Hemoglobin n=1 Tax=Stella humosa TaxID=94 RepID=A0A3N1M7N8_9PROT|nr:group III truncated hemoglobin [Stella humosa]ROQ01842.1 hemoglobin [Stella humosa]BBK32231.1 preprotein translocase subunit TatC [Stella humosa]